MTRFGRIVLLVVAAGAAGCAEEKRSARLELKEEVVDLGVRDPGESDFDFAFRNVGTGSLMVEKVGSTCSCTQAEATPRVEPAGSGTVRVRSMSWADPAGRC